MYYCLNVKHKTMNTNKYMEMLNLMNHDKTKDCISYFFLRSCLSTFFIKREKKKRPLQHEHWRRGPMLNGTHQNKSPNVTATTIGDLSN